jgi:hypothetical protein
MTVVRGPSRSGYPNARDCEHGRLRRACELCDLMAERDRAIETRENANAVSVRVEAENARLRGALERIKERADRIVAGEFGGLDAALEISNEARRALRG